MARKYCEGLTNDNFPKLGFGKDVCLDFEHTRNDYYEKRDRDTASNFLLNLDSEVNRIVIDLSFDM
jgi:hypothetical protein